MATVKEAYQRRIDKWLSAQAAARKELDGLRQDRINLESQIDAVLTELKTIAVGIYTNERRLNEVE